MDTAHWDQMECGTADCAIVRRLMFYRAQRRASKKIASNRRVDHIIAVVILRNVRGITNSQPILSDENFATPR